VIRGGSWNNNARNVRAAYRNWNDPTNRWNNQGFRCAQARSTIGGSASEQTVILSGRYGGRQKANGRRRAGSASGLRANARRSADFLPRFGV